MESRDSVEVARQVKDGALRQRIADAGFAIVGWDEVLGSIRRTSGEEVAFIGSHAEVAAYVQAWERCSAVVTATHLQEQAQSDRARMIHRSMLVVSSGDGILGEEGVPRFAPRGTRIRESAPVPWQRTYDLVVRPQIPFRGIRVAIPDEFAHRFDVLDVRVGNRSMFPISEAVPGEAFAMRISQRALLAIEEDATPASGATPVRIVVDLPALGEFGRELTMDTCWQSMDLTMVVRPRPGVRSRFVAVILGYTA